MPKTKAKKKEKKVNFFSSLMGGMAGGAAENLRAGPMRNMDATSRNRAKKKKKKR